MKKRAKYTRDVAEQYYNQSTANLYGKRISETNMEAEYVNKITKQLEEREAMMLAKLQTTYTQEKSVIKKLNELSAQSPVMAKQRGGAVSQSIS
jgi:lipoate-protein ligase B